MPEATMTFNLSAKEMAGLERMATEADMSKTAVLRSALRLYELVTTRVRAGEQMFFSGDRERALLFIGPGFDPPSDDRRTP